MPRRQAKLETIVSIVDELVGLESIGDIVRSIARGFVEIGAVMSIILVCDGDCDHATPAAARRGKLRVAARWPEAEVDALFRAVRGESPMDFAIDLAHDDNPYVKVLCRGAPELIEGSEAIMAHLAATYGVDPAKMGPVRARLSGKAGVLLPLVSGGERLGIAAINYGSELELPDLALFDIFARSATSMLRFKREVVGREQILADLEAALEKERRTRAELNRAERLAALGEMAAVVAHEIRNPVAVINNSLASLRRHVRPEPEAELLQRICHEETARIERIIDDMLALAVPSGSRRQPVDIREVVGRAIFLAREQCDDAPPLDVDERYELPLRRVEGDAHGLTQAFVNLLINAYEAGGDRIVVTARPARGSEDPVVQVVIRDRGAGIDEATLAQIWEPFYTTKASGTGLGLPIVKRVIDAHRGRILVESAPGRGTEVTIELPAAEA